MNYCKPRTADFVPDTFVVNCIGGCSTISDQNGDLLFFTNGINIYNKDGSIMEGGANINPGNYNDQYASLGYPVQQSILIFPIPDQPNSYYVVHVGIGDTPNYSVPGLKLYTSKVVSPSSTGNLKVIKKNTVILSDTIGGINITACKHANGRDWWLIVPKIASNKYWVYLIDIEGVHLINEQNIGYVMGWPDWSGQSIFSTDGSKFIRYDQFNKLNIYDFDRCTGMLSNPLHLAHPFASSDSLVPGGVSVSPNSRYLYLSVAAWVYQYDLWASDIGASRVLVGEYDGTQAPFPTSFFRSILAPDGKIYINCTNSNYTVHVIHQPDEAGANCQFENNAYTFDNFIYWAAMPSFPNYRLGALIGSSCDTITTGTAPTAGFTWSLPDSTISPLKVKFKDTSLGSPESWSWNFGDGSFSQDSSPVHIFPSSGIWHTCLIAGNNFGADTTCQDIILSAVSTTEGLGEKAYVLEITPNPAKENITITWTNGSQSEAVLMIYNNLQQVVFESTIKGAHFVKINTGQFASGSYHAVLIREGKKVFHKTFIIR